MLQNIKNWLYTYLLDQYDNGLYGIFFLTVSGGKFKLVINLNIKVTAWYGENDPIYIETLRLVTQTVSRIFKFSIVISMLWFFVVAYR